MIPISLTIRNFLPYRAPDPVRFDGVHLACLTGSNGAGKSSLLDAMTWALWGKARARRDDELVHLGQGEMFVQLDFAQEGNRYRVIRRRAAGKRGQGTLDFFVLDSEAQQLNLTEGNMRNTQARINALLRLDYETFVHSAFLQQGKADAFTTRTPAERKRILSDILGLERWAKYEEAAKEKLKAIEGDLRLFDDRIAEIDKELQQRPGLERDLKDAQANLDTAREARANAEARLKEVESAPADLKHARKDRAAIDARLAEIARDIQTTAESIATVNGQIETYQTIIAARAEIESGYAALSDARQTDKQLSAKLRKLAPLNDQRAALENELTQNRARLQAELDGLHARRDELQAEVAHDYDTEIATVSAEVGELQAQDSDRERIESALGERKEERARVDATLKSLETEGKALTEQLSKLENAAPELAICPTCGQSLSVEQRERVMGELSEAIEVRRDQYRTAQERIKSLDAEIKRDNAAIKALKTELKRLEPLLQRLGTLRGQADNRDQAQATLDGVQTQIETLTAELETEAYAVEIRERLATVETQRAALGYDASAAEDASATIDTHLQYEEMHTRLTVALEALPNYQRQHAAHETQRDNLTAIKAEKEAEAEKLDGEIKRLGVLVEEYQRRDEEVTAQRTIEQTSYERVVNCEQALRALGEQERRKSSFIERRATAREQKAIYDELRRAFGKDGVPAMIIEAAIPELEQSANALLSRMTDGRMHLRMNTQREKVTGGQMETLEIAIADELGERNYELYSGGEAFRINFAIRVALSQMLARRAGAHLRTLFIDEGFGTQDDNGREKLVEAITAIQDEFDMVLVITHIDELRDSFPVHIEIQKTPDGSRIAMR